MERADIKGKKQQDGASRSIFINLLSYKDSEVILEKAKERHAMGLYLNPESSQKVSRIHKELHVQV